MRGQVDDEPRADAAADERRRSIGWVLPAGVLIAVVVLISVGIARLASDPSGVSEARALPSPETSVAPASPVPTPITLAKVSFVDVRTGRATPLPRSIRSLPSPTQFQTSPNGARLAFASADGIYVARVDGTAVRLVMDTPTAAAPSWSPDGSTLVYSEGNEGLVVDVRTGAVTTVVSAPGAILHPNFSPDGRTILFTLVAGGGPELWTAPATGGPSTLLLRLEFKRTYAAFGTYAPDGTIAYRRTNYDGLDVTEMTEASLWLADREGRQRHALHIGGSSMSQGDPDALWPMWSPDGSRIAYEPLITSGVFVVDPATGDRHKIGEGTRPAWVDDETLIVEGYRRGDGA